jgi:hypothetical protein
MKVFIDPPIEVTDAVAKLQAACANWHATDVPTAPVPAPRDLQGTEAYVCLYAKNPEAHDWAVMQMTGLGLLMALGMVCLICSMTGIHRLPSFLIRVSCSAFRRMRA